MKFICFGYIDINVFLVCFYLEQIVLMDSCCEYDDWLCVQGYFKGGEVFQLVNIVKILCYMVGCFVVIDGLFVEIKEQIGGILIFEVCDFDYVVEFILKYFGVGMGLWEICLVVDFDEMVC